MNTKKIHQIYISDNNNPPSDYVITQMNKLKNLYSDYDYILYNNEMCRNEIKSLIGTKAVNLYDSLNSYSFRADFARYVILFKFGGYYFDSIICPEFKLEFNDHPVMYLPPKNHCYNMNAIENGVMLFNKPQHVFIEKAIELCLKNINQKNYGKNALDVTGPVTLGRIENTYDIKFGQSKSLSPDERKKYKTDKAAYFGDIIHWLYRPSGTYLKDFKCIGTNSYENLWFNKQIFNTL
jgi:mannosyltransferase OCH1-like enzyme